ncbi:MAG: efflux RND transporter periplasmic adaptor subunit [Acidobacteria bacterium]|nr:MAG: efflux RND transporter periplasmic adaptor subunit [Acidobacteriota bacterium]
MTPTMITALASRRGATFLFCAIAAILCLASGCSKDEKEKEPVVSVQTTPAQRAPISQVISAEAVVYPLEQATIAPKISSTIKKFHVQRGAHVKKGQLLADLENKDLSAAAESSKGDFEQADANYVTTVDASLPQQIQKAQLDAVAAKSNFEAQQKVYESRKELFQQGSAEVAFLQARSQNEQAQKQLTDLQRVGKEQVLKSAQGSRTSAEGRMKGAEAQLSYSRILSPIDGVVTDRPLFEGDLATANQPILTVMNTSRLIAKAHIPQSDAAVLKVGNPAELKIPGLDEPVKGRVSLVSPALDPGSTTIEVWVEASKPDPALKPGMTVELSMTAKMVKDALVVPTPAIYKNSEGADYVLLVGSDGHAHVKTVEVGVRNAEFAQIVSGVKAGNQVINSGGYGLPDNTQIKIEAAPAEKDADDKSSKPEKPGASAKPAAKNAKGKE